MRILLAIPTRNRPGLLDRCLRSLMAGAASDRHEVQVLVVDNGSDPDRAPDIGRLQAAAPDLDVALVVEPRRGIPFARNRALDEADARGADALAFLDDDQTVQPGWLDALADAQQQTGAAAVKSAVRWEFEPPGLYRDHFRDDIADPPPERPDGGFEFVATNGVLVMGRLWRRHGLRFDERFPAAGGEDTLFFTQATRRGERLAMTRDTFATEFCPAAKQTRGWLLRRAYSVGNHEVILGLKPRSPLTTVVRRGPKVLYEILIGGLLAPVNRRRSFRHLMKAAKALGAVTGSLGMAYGAYRTTVGR
jgi:succinoglycan biosynthesis protein ExoM